jgi:hypothetical protein
VNSQVTRTIHQPVQPCAKSSGRPESCISKAMPAMEFRVAPILASFGSSGSGTSGCPSAPHFRSRLPMWLRVAPRTASSGSAGDRVSSFLVPRVLRRHWLIESSGRPESSLFQLRLSMLLPSCPGFHIFRPCRRWIFELPRISHPSALRGAPAPGLPPQLGSSRCACQ